MYLSIHFLKTEEPLSYPENLFDQQVRQIDYSHAPSPCVLSYD